MKYAWIENGRIRDVCGSTPAECYHPDIAALYSAVVPDDAENGDGWDGITLTKPTPPSPAPVDPVAIPAKVSPVEFKLLFTPQERVAIKQARAVDPVIDDFYDIVEDHRLTHVDLGLQSTQAALDYLTMKGLIAVGRKDQIIVGAVQ